MIEINTNFKLTHNLAISLVSSLRTCGKLLVFAAGGHNIDIEKSIKIRSDNKLKKIYLKGIVYHGGLNFVSHVVGKDNTVQFHDGELGRSCIYEKS
jgi:hypothetical protein